MDGLSKGNRYSSAIRYALSQEITPDDLPRFLKDNGGVDGCLAKFQALKRADEKSASPEVSAEPLAGSDEERESVGKVGKIVIKTCPRLKKKARQLKGGRR